MAAEISERERLRSLVADYCVSNGVADLTLRNVGRAVGTNNRMLLYYFGSKEGLILEALTEANSRFPQLQGVFGALDDRNQALLPRLLEAWKSISAEVNLPYLRLFFEIFGLAAQKPARFANFLDNVGSDWSQRVAAVLRAEGVPIVESRVMGRELVALWRGLQFDLISSGERRSIERTYEAAARDFARRAATLATTRTLG